MSKKPTPRQGQKSLSDQKETKAKIAQNNDDVKALDEERALPFVKPIMNKKPNKWGRQTISNVASMLAATFLSLLFLVHYYSINLDSILDSVRNQAVDSLTFLFPEYYVSIDEVAVDASNSRDGWAVIRNVLLVDAVEERSITIDEISMAPAILSLLFGDTQFNHLSANDVVFDFKLEPPKQDSELSIPISILDIPANIVNTYGDIQLENMTVRLVSSENKEVFSVTDLQADLRKQPDGYDARISARQTDREEGRFDFKVSREDGVITWDALAEEYKIAPDSDLILDFKLNMGFDGVPEYDLTEVQDNAAKPYQYLERGDGVIKVHGGDINAEAQFDYDNVDDVLRFENMLLAIGEQNFRGNVDVTLGDAIYARGYEFGAEYEGISGPVEFGGGSFFARINIPDQNIDIGEISFSNDYFKIYGQAQATLQPEPRFGMNLQSDDIEYKNIRGLWPKDVAQKQLKLIEDNLEFNAVKDMKLWARYTDEFRLEADMIATDLKISATKTVPPIFTKLAKIHLTDDNFSLRADSADFIGFENAIDFDDVRVDIADFSAKPLVGDISFQADGDLRALYDSLESQSFSMSKSTKIPANRVSGRFDADFDISIPFKSGLTFSEMDLNANGSLRDVSMEGFAAGEDIRVKYADLQLTQNGVTASGQGAVGSIPVKAELKQRFAPGNTPDIHVEARVSKSALREFGVNVPSLLQMGTLPVTADIKLRQGGLLDFKAKIDARQLGFKYPAIGTVKSYGSPGDITASGQLGSGGVRNIDFRIDLNKFDAVGSYSPSEGLRIPRFYLLNYYDGEVYLKGRTVTLQNGVIDFRNVKISSSDRDFPPWTIYAKNINAKLQGDLSASSVNGFFQSGLNTRGEFTGLVGGKAPIKALAWTGEDGINLQLVADDAGEFFRAANLFGGINGGYLNLRLKATPYPGTYAGKFDINNFALTGDNTAVRLIKAASIIGIFEPKQMSFTNLNADFLYMPDRFNLYSGYAYGPSLGVTLGGTYSTSQKYADFFGVVTPAYLLNGAFQKIPLFGELLGGNVGEGLFGITYRVYGPASDPTLQVNPLSLLTPGKLRDIWGNVPQANELPDNLRIK